MREESWRQQHMLGDPPDVVIELRLDTVNGGLCWWQLQVYGRDRKELLALEAHPVQPDRDPDPQLVEALRCMRELLDTYLGPFGSPSSGS